MESLIIIFNNKTLLGVKFQLEIKIKQNHPKLNNIVMENELQIRPFSLLEYEDKNEFRNQQAFLKCCFII